MMETKATIWVHLNVLKLGQAFGAAMGCEKEAYALCMKMDQKKNLERCAGKGKSSDNNNYTIPKELKDCVLEFLEAIQEQRALTDDDAFQKSNLTKEFEEVASNEDIAWRQR
ncbi:hypothetical protein MTR67_007129 [Solanum verrucosum]|uniref:Uncharacterized protein n=1 Tax=Solanum verrucosum TaxID=315347 RepID=A0AAF0Q5I2_SOLVR|nr:hypothetical protein MTR67_007129 [Solanum verrucosum]